MMNITAIKVELGLVKGTQLKWSRSPMKDDDNEIIMDGENPIMSDWYRFSAKGMKGNVVCHHEVFSVIAKSERLFLKEGVNEDGEEYIAISEFSEHTMTGSI